MSGYQEHTNAIINLVESLRERAQSIIDEEGIDQVQEDLNTLSQHFKSLPYDEKLALCGLLAATGMVELRGLKFHTGPGTSVSIASDPFRIGEYEDE